jgi:Zn finger protein HypA/HybF involved in hydrogenase expression
MKRNVAIGIVLVAIVFSAVGLVFLCAATQQPSRYLPGFAFIGIGAGLAAWSGLSLRRWRALDPENLSDRITELARKGGQYEVTLSEVVAELRVPDEVAQAALDLLVSKGQCRREPREGRTIYVFPGLKESKVVRRCVYCGSEFSVKEPLHTCPNCGGEVQLVRE